MRDVTYTGLLRHVLLDTGFELEPLPIDASPFDECAAAVVGRQPVSSSMRILALRGGYRAT